MAEYETAHGGEVLALELRAQRPVGLLDRGTPVQGEGAVGKFAYGRIFLVELVANLADDLLDYVLHGYYPLKRAPLVYDDGHTKPAVLEVLEDGVHAPVLGDGQNLAHDLSGPHLHPEAAVLHGAHDVFRVHRPDYPLLGVVLVDRVAGVLPGGDGPKEIPQGHACWQRGDVGSGDHDLARRRVLEGQDRVQHAVLLCAKYPLLGRAVDDQAQLVLGVLLLGLGGRGHPEEPHRGVGDAVEDDHAGVEEVIEEPHEGRHEERGPLRFGDGHALGRELPEDHVQEGDNGEADGEADGEGYGEGY